MSPERPPPPRIDPEAVACGLPEFERTSGIKVTTESGASQGAGPQTIAAQLARGVPADVVILSTEGLEENAQCIAHSWATRRMGHVIPVLIPPVQKFAVYREGARPSATFASAATIPAPVFGNSFRK